MTDAEKWRLVRIADGVEVQPGERHNADAGRFLVDSYDGGRVYVRRSLSLAGGAPYGKPVKRRPHLIGLRIELRK